MRKAIMLVLALGLIVGMAGSATAAVENVKVGGDITIKGIYRSNFDFTDGGLVDGMHYIYAGTRVYVCADLTNKVSTMIRFINERDFGNDYLREIGGSVLLDLAYVKLSDLVVPGLNLTLGRQEYQIGEGMVLGSRYRALDYVGADIGTAAVDLGMQKAFDAVKLEYALASAPISFELFRAKILESYINPSIGPVQLKDIDLTSLSVNLKSDTFTLNPYVVHLASDGTLTVGPFTGSPTLWTAGVRGTWNPLGALSLKLEAAKQFGELNPGLDFEGWGGYVSGDWSFGGSMRPIVKVGYSHFTGLDSSGDISAWVPVFPSNVASRVGKIGYAALFPAGEGLGLGLLGLGSTGSGVGAINVGFGIQPTEKIGLSLDLFNLRYLESPTSKTIGNEIDLGISYAYSEDVSLGLEVGYFLTGDNIENTLGGNDENAWQAIATVKVAF